MVNSGSARTKSDNSALRYTKDSYWLACMHNLYQKNIKLKHPNAEKV